MKMFSHQITRYKRVVLLLLIMLFIGPAMIALGQEGGEPDLSEENLPTDHILPEGISSLAWSPDGLYIAFGVEVPRCNQQNNDYSVRILDVQTGLVVATSQGYHRCSINSVDWSSDGTKLVSAGSLDGTAVVWDTSSWQAISVYNRATQLGFIDTIWNPFNNQIASVWELNTEVVIWDALTSQTIFVLTIANPSSISWSPTGDEFAVGGENVSIWNALSGQLSVTLNTGPAREVTWSPDGTLIAGVEGQSTLRTWDVINGNVVRMFEGQTGRIEDIAWSPNNSTIASASSDGTVRIWNTNTGEQLGIFQYPGPIYALDWSPDGTRLAYGGVGGTVEIAPAPGVETPTPTPSDTPTFTPTFTPTHTPTHTPTNTPTPPPTGGPDQILFASSSRG